VSLKTNQSHTHLLPNKQDQRKRKVHAVPAIVVQLAHQVSQAATEAMVLTVNLVNQENVVTQPHLNHQSWTNSPNNAHVKPHQANKDQPDPKAQMDQQEMPVNPEAMANQETKDHAVHQAKPANPVKLVKKVPQAKLAKPHPKLAQLVLQVAQEKLVPQALQVKPDLLAKTVVQVAQAQQEMQELQEVQANQVHQAQMANQANKETQEAAPTAHQLVWLQDIKDHPDPFRRFDRELELNLFNASFIVMFFQLFKSHFVR
jgi:hypothetical protein